MACGYALLAVFAWWLTPTLASAGCVPVAKAPGAIVPVAFQHVATPPAGRVSLTFVGHSTFLIESPGGAAAATDFNGMLVPSRMPDIVTMNIAHSTHHTELVPSAVKFVLRGWDFKLGMANHDLRYRDMRVRNVPTNLRDFDGGTRANANSIFVFEVADICIAHLGHLHHLLEPVHLGELGQIDILLVPVDGGFTMGQLDMLDVMQQIKAPLVIPMHYFSLANLQRFIDRASGHYRPRQNGGPSVTLSRAELPRPQSPEILVLLGPH
jgi:L-ascorbate metabolism protein UlaG (beta-lactamase superfamily)